MIIFVAKLIAISLTCGLVNVFRGGWSDNFSMKPWVRKIIASQTLCRFIIIGLTTYSVLSPFPFQGYPFTILTFLTLLYFGLIAGWGTWFFIDSRDGWKHNFDAFWVEILMTLFMGKHWIPEGETCKREQSRWTSWTVEESPTGEARPQRWCEDYNLYAMSLRGFGFGLVVCIILCKLGGLNPLFIIMIILSLNMSIYYCKWYDYRDVNKLDRLPKFMRDSNNRLGEFLYGLLALGAAPYLVSAASAELALFTR